MVSIEKCLKDSIKSIKDLNWAWQYWCPDSQNWIQFPCTECIKLELDFQVYRVSQKKQHSESDILQGKVNFETNILHSNDEFQETIQVRRSPDNRRSRPNSQSRHDPFVQLALDSERLNFTSSTDLEWMSLNYRKQRAANISHSKRRVILGMFLKDFRYFPTVKEIRDELINA